ncbi:MAG: hypothetical protein ABI611_20415 [Solirubrobacteraceae bacterium]
MSLFRKKSRSQAERLASWRSEALTGGGRALDGVGPLLEELGADASEQRDGWVVELAGDRLFIAAIDDGTTLSGWAPIEDTHDAGELLALLRRNLEPRLVWTCRSDAGGTDELGARFAVPLDGFDRGAVLLVLEAMAGALGDEPIATRARDLREPPRGEADEQAANARVTEAVQTALATLGLSPESDSERPGVWRVAAERGVVELVLRDTGESLLLMHELEYAGGEADVEALRWLLLAGDWGSARMGVASLPGGPGLFSVCAVPAASLEPQALAWGMAEVLRLSDEYDRLAAG